MLLLTFFHCLLNARSIDTSDNSIAASSETVKNICIADDQSQCKLGIEYEFINTKSAKATDFYYSGTLNVYLFSKITSFNIEVKNLKGNLNVYGSASSNTNADICFKSDILIRPDVQINLNNVKCQLYDKVLYAKNLFLNNSELVSNVESAAKEVSIYVEDLKSDAISLINTIKVQVNKFTLTEIQKELKSDINIDVALSFLKENVVNILGNATDKIKATLKRRQVDIQSSINDHVVRIKSDIALPNINFENIKKEVEIVRGEFLNAIEMFHFNIDLEGGKVRFPEDTWPLSLSLQSFFTGPVFNIVQNISSTIEIGARRLPADIINNGTDPLNIKALVTKCGITGKLFINNTLDKINSDLNEAIDFSVRGVERLNQHAQLVSDKFMKLLSEIEPAVNALSNKIKNVVDEINVAKQKVQKEIFNLAENGHLNIDFDYDRDGKFSSGQITFDGEVKRDGNGKFTIDLNGGISGGLEDYSFEKLKKLINQPQNLVCSKISVKSDDWLLKTFNEDFKDVLKIQRGDTPEGLHCIQLVLTGLPRSMSEKYCIGNDCPEGYTVIDKEAIKNLKTKVHERTHKVVLNVKEGLDTSHSIEFSGYGGDVAFSIDGNNKNVNIDLDLTAKDHIASLDISKSNLNFNIKNNEANNYLEINVPSLSLNDVTVNGQLKDKKIEFSGDKVNTDLSTFKQLVEAKFNSLVLDLENTGILDKVKSIEVDQDGNINFKGSVLGQKIASVDFANVAKDLAIKFNTGTISSLDLKVDSNLKSTKGFKLDIKKSLSSQIMGQTINFDDNWGKISDFGGGVTISRETDLVLNNVPGNLDITFEGNGKIEIHLKAGSKEFRINRKYEVKSDTKFNINGDVFFADLQLSGNSKLNVESSSSSGTLLAASNKVVVGTATCSQDSVVSVDDLVVNNELVMEPKSTLTANTITMNNKPLIVRYEMGSFPEIYTKSKPGMTKPSNIILQYALTKSDNANDVNYDEYIGHSNNIYCSNNETFTLDNCNEYSKIVSYSSDFEGFNGDTSAMKTRCISIPNSKNKQQVDVCLISELSESPSLQEVKEEKEENPKKKKNVGLIVGVTVAAVAVLAIIIIVVVIVVKKKNSSKSDNSRPKASEAEIMGV